MPRQLNHPLTSKELEALQRVRTVSVHDRQHKVRVADFVAPQAWQASGNLRALFPRLLKGLDIVDIVDGFVAAHQCGRAVILAMGAHVIKCGLSPILIDMMQRGWLSGLVLNGAGVIHDLEVALIGATSEDVAQGLGSGAFGMVEETPCLINEALKAYGADRLGIGATLGQAIAEGDYPHKTHSLLGTAYACHVPVTVHVAIGADTIHIGTHHALCICTVLLSSPWKATFHRASTALSFQLALHVLQVVAESLLLGLWKATFHGASTALSFLVAACTSGRRRSSAFGTL